MIAFLFIFLFIVALFLTLLPPSSGKPEPFRDENGNILPGSLSEKCYVNVDGQELGMFLRAEDQNNPVLLLCGGGPGISEYLLEDMYPSKLAASFVVCYLEYRGTGLSYDSSINPSDMTTERYLQDIYAVTDYLKERFNQEKIYILGHSFGSSLAIRAAYEKPEYYHAYIAMSQICDQRTSEYLAYDYMKEQYEQLGNSKMVQKFADCPIRQSEAYYKKYFNSSLRDTAMHDLGIGTTRDMHSVITGIVFPSLKCKAFTPMERINIWCSKIASGSYPIQSESLVLNTFEEIKALQIPVYFFAGKYDYTCCYSLQKEYYEFLKAPVKKFYTFENSAHSPLFEEPEKAYQIIEEDILV